jgi:hypothetical protein
MLRCHHVNGEAHLTRVVISGAPRDPSISANFLHKIEGKKPVIRNRGGTIKEKTSENSPVALSLSSKGTYFGLKTIHSTSPETAAE